MHVLSGKHGSVKLLQRLEGALMWKLQIQKINININYKYENTKILLKICNVRFCGLALHLLNKSFEN